MSQLPTRPETPTNRHFWYTLSAEAPPDKIWSVWTDVSNWYRWDTGLEQATLKGEFREGAEGTIRSGGMTTAFRVSTYVRGESYTITSRLPSAALHVHRSLRMEQGKALITHEVWFSGLLAGLFAVVFGRKFRPQLATVVANIKNIAECS